MNWMDGIISYLFLRSVPEFSEVSITCIIKYRYNVEMDPDFEISRVAYLFFFYCLIFIFATFEYRVDLVATSRAKK